MPVRPHTNYLKIGTWGPDTDVIAGQQVPTRSRDPYFPLGYAAVAQRVPNITPTVPPMIGGAGGVSMSDNTAAAMTNPWSLFHSPLPWAIGMLVVGLLGLRFIHWRAAS
jgi:hypothetical protein